MGWCCHTPNWRHNKRQRTQYLGGATTWECSRCQWIGVWENNDKFQIFTNDGTRIPTAVVRELSRT